MSLETITYLLVAVALLFLNAFFVLAEFAVVKVRTSRIQELVDKGSGPARLVQHIQSRLDEYLSVCQVGITFASIALGFVGEPALARLLEPWVRWTGAASAAVAHGISVTLAYLIISFLHILLGELVPKSMALRTPDRAAILSARPLRFFHVLFYLPLFVLNGAANGVLRLLGVPREVRESVHTEDELRILLAGSQSKGVLSFRRLLLFENLFDLGELCVSDCMRSKDSARALRTEQSWEENLQIVRDSKYSRYPLLEAGKDLPVGIVHVKDFLCVDSSQHSMEGLRKIARPYLTVLENSPLELLLAKLQRNRVHLAVVTDGAGRWTGFITLEDIIEEIIGTIEDEFESEPPLYLSDAFTPGRIVLGLGASTMVEAIRELLSKIPSAELPQPRAQIEKAVLDRERAMSTYLGTGLAVPHARLPGLQKAAVFFGRSDAGIPVASGSERCHLLFLLLAPAHAPHLQVRLLARIAGLMESEYVRDRLAEAPTPQSIYDAIREAESVTLG